MIAGILAACIVAAFLGGYTMGKYDDTAKAPTEIQQVQPQATTNQPTQQPQQGPTIIQNVSADDDPVIGSDDAKITIIEFSDFQCPFCERFATNTFSQLKTEYVDSGKVKFVYRDFPLDRIHPNARGAALAAGCANEQDKFWEYHDSLFSQQNNWASLNPASASMIFIDIATELNMDKSTFSVCLESQKYNNEVGKDYSDGRQYGVTGTPTFFIGNSEDGFTKVTGSQSIGALRNIIDRQLTQ